ncbi:MAG: TetR/AcrR family transcriptional regulator [Acidimicrobiales bacterium]
MTATTSPQSPSERPGGHSRRDRQAERVERSRRALLDAAADIINEEGFAALTHARVGERAGYSRGLVTERFGSKQALIGALIEETSWAWERRQIGEASDGATGLQTIVGFLKGVAEQARQDGRWLRVFYGLLNEALRDPTLADQAALMHRSMRRSIASCVECGIADGSIRADASPYGVAVGIVAGLRGIGYQWLLDPDVIDAVEAIDNLAATTELALEVRRP